MDFVDVVLEDVLVVIVLVLVVDFFDVFVVFEFLIEENDDV